MSKLTKTDAARLIGMAEREVVDFEDSPAGPVIRTVDGNTYVVVDADDPQYDAKTKGVMFLVPPTERYKGTFPVYANPPADDQPSARDAAADKVEDDLGVDLDDAGKRTTADDELTVAGQVDPSASRGPGRPPKGA